MGSPLRNPPPDQPGVGGPEECGGTSALFLLNHLLVLFKPIPVSTEDHPEKCWGMRRGWQPSCEPWPRPPPPNKQGAGRRFSARPGQAQPVEAHTLGVGGRRRLLRYF